MLPPDRTSPPAPHEGAPYDSNLGAPVDSPVAKRDTTWLSVGEVLACSGFPTQLAIGALLQMSGIRPMNAAGDLSATFVFALSLLDAALLLSLIAVFLRRRGERITTVVLGSRPVGGEVAYGLFTLPMLGAIVIATSVIVRLIAPSLHNIPDNPLEKLLGSQGGLVMFLLVVIVAGGIREEVQRAFLLHRFGQDLGGVRVGLFVTSVAFGLGHTLQGWDVAVITALLGAAWGAIYISRGSAVAGIVSHSLFNSGELLRVFLVK